MRAASGGDRVNDRMPAQVFGSPNVGGVVSLSSCLFTLMVRVPGWKVGPKTDGYRGSAQRSVGWIH